MADAANLTRAKEVKAVSSIENIVAAFRQHIHKYDRHYDRWCVGTTNDPERREREPREFPWYARASSESAARSVESTMLAIGCCGGRGGGIGDVVCVYLCHRG